jgi:hypothetical protein
MPAPKRIASPAPKKRAKLVKPLPLPLAQTPVIAVPALGLGLTADPTFAALMIPAKATLPGGKVATAGAVFLRGILNVNPAQGAVSAPATLFTLPAGMRPSCDSYLIATYRDQWSAPVVPIVLSLGTSGAVGLVAVSLGYDSMIWLDGLSFML